MGAMLCVYAHNIAPPYAHTDRPITCVYAHTIAPPYAHTDGPITFL